MRQSPTLPGRRLLVAVLAVVVGPLLVVSSTATPAQTWRAPVV